MSAFLGEYAHIVTDLPHLAAEVTFMLVIDVLVLGCVWPLLKRLVDRAHARIDEEHGVDHDEAVRQQAMREAFQCLHDLGWIGPQPQDQVQTPV